MKCQRCSKADAIGCCRKCQHSLCQGCLRLEMEDTQHATELYYFCQECEVQPASKFCFSCDQHLCELCNGRIHNKGKRAKHQVDEVVSASKLKIVYTVVIMADNRQIGQDSNELFLLLCERLPNGSSNEAELTPQNVHLFIQESLHFPLEGFSHSLVSADQLSEQFFQEYCKYFPLHRKTVIIDSPEGRKLKARLPCDISLLPVGEPSCNSVINHNVEPRVNISSSTENESMTKSKKPPIAYFQFYKLAKEDKRSEVELRMRKLAAEGVLLLRRKEIEPMDGVIRTFTRTIGDLEIDYCALEISYLSFESLIWVIRSIKLDMMTPGEKLILSRIKECFDIKLHSKFWQSILNYIGSSKYQVEYERGSFGFNLPKILLNRTSEEAQLTLKGEEWVFEDQEKLDENSQQWKEFVKFLLDYFDKSQAIPGGRYGCVQFVKTSGPESLRSTSLGRLSLYVQEAINKGIIRYHKTLLIRNVLEQHMSLTNESSSFHEADYSFNLNEKQLHVKQNQLKIRSIQLALIKILLENPHESPISLAQIPLYLKKSLMFSYNLPNLGFPKLKNLIMTLSDKVELDINKSTLSYCFHPNSEMLINREKELLHCAAQEYLKIIVEIIVKIARDYQHITVDDLCVELNLKLGYAFEYGIYNVPDFYQFLVYYCQECIYINFMSGTFIAEVKYHRYTEYKRQQTYQQWNTNSGCYRENPELLTGHLNSQQSTKQSFGENIADYYWRNHGLEEDRKEDVEEGCFETKEIIGAIKKSIEGILMDDDKSSERTPKTVIENENVVNDLAWSQSAVNPDHPTYNISVHNKMRHIKTASAQFEDQKGIASKHGRFGSTVEGTYRPIDYCDK